MAGALCGGPGPWPPLPLALAEDHQQWRREQAEQALTGPPDHPYNVGFRNEPCRPPKTLDATGKWEWRVKWKMGRRAAEDRELEEVNG